MDPAKIKQAREAGYSDKEIADHLATSNPKIQAARDAGYQDAEILGHLAPGPGLVRRTLNAVGDAVGATDDYLSTQAARAAGNVASLPGVIGKGAEWAYGKLGIDPADLWGEQGAKVLKSFGEYPTSDEISGTLLESGGKTPSNLEGAIPGGKIVDTAVQGALTAPVSLPMLVAGATGGAGSEIGRQGFEGTSLEIPAALIGGLLGGVGGAGAVSAAGKAARVGKAAVEPFREAGRDKIVGSVLRERSADPDAAIANIDKYKTPESVPGFRINAGQASRDPGLMGIADVAGTQNPGMRAQVQANNVAVTGALDKAAAGLPDPAGSGATIQSVLRNRYDTLKGARSAAVDPLYDAARSSQTPVKPFPLMTYTADTVAATKGEPRTVMQKARSLLFDKAGKADRSAAGAIATRQAINDMLDNPQLGNYSKSLLMEMRSKVDDVLSAVPEEAAARTKFAEMSKPLEPFDPKLGNKAVADVIAKDPYGKGFLKPAEKVTGDLSAPTTQKIMMAAGGDPQVKQALASAYIADFRKAAASKVAEDAAGNPMMGANNTAKWLEKHRGGASNVLTAEQIKALEDISRALKDQAQPIPGRVGSQTYDRLGTESILGALISPRFADAPVLHPIKRALGLVYGGADEAAMNRLYEVIADPQLTAALMKKATEGNVKMVEPLLKRLGQGAAVGAIPAAGKETP